MLELKELLEEREALRQEEAQKLKEEGLKEQKENQLHKQKRIKGYLLKLAKRGEYNPRYYEEYEQLLRRKEYLKDYYRYV